MAPILCTQPRRFAVVAVAKMVAKARNCELGEEVGYHIGHSKHLSATYVNIMHVLCLNMSVNFYILFLGSKIVKEFHSSNII